MKQRNLKRAVSVLLALVMLIGFVPVLELPAAAKEVTGNVKASQLPAGDGLVLTGHTVLNMDTNLSLAYIKGDYDLLVEGGGVLTIVGTNVGIKVNKLEVRSNLHVQTTSGYAIKTTGVTYLSCAALYVNGGIHANCVTIYSYDAVIAGSGQAIYAFYDIALSGKIAVGAQKEALCADNGYIYMEGDIECNSLDDNDYCIVAGNSIYTDTSVNLKVRGGGGLCSKIGHIELSGDVVDVQSQFKDAFIAEEGNVDITAKRVSVITDIGATLSGVEVYVNADEMHLENQATGKNSQFSQNGIVAKSKVALVSNFGTVAGYNNGIHVEDTANKYPDHFIYLSGDISVVGKNGAALCVPQGIADNYGTVTLAGKTYGIDAYDVHFDGTRMNVSGNTAVYARHGVELTGSDVKITATGSRNSGIWCENGYVELTGSVVINTNGWYGINTAGDLTLNNGCYEVRGPEANAQAVKLGGTLTMAPTLEIIEPKYGHVNGNEIYGAGDSPAMEFVIYSPIEMVDIYVSTPAAGLTPIWDSTAVYGLPTHTSFESIVWYENGVEMDRNTPFTAGKTYKVKVTVAGEDGYRFRNDIAGKVNGKVASTGIIYQPPQVILTADLGTCPASVSEVDLEIDRPVEGSKPSTSVSAFESTYGVRSSNVSWSVSNDGVNFTSMGANQTFVAGKYYRVYMDVTLASTKYVFRITTKDGSVQPAVNATVNCSPATVIKAYEQDPEDVITVYYDFGMCNDSFVEEVNVVDLVAPVAGQHPSYTANVFGTGYHIDTTRNSYEDIYWKNPPEKWYYVKNGVQWYDTTTGSYEYVYENDTFIPGHTYSCTIYISVDDGFTFARTNGAFQLTATVNGNAAEIVTGWTDTWNTRVTYEFSCSARQISSVRVDGLEEPSAGATPDYSATVAVPEDYQLDSTFGQNGIAWYNCEGMEMAPTETFMEGEPYCIAIRLNAAVGAAFAAEPDFFINGKEVNTYGWWDKVVVDGNKVIAYYTFRKASAAPVLGASVSGTVTSQGSQTDAITLKLYDFNTGTLAHETTVRGNQANYSFANVTAGVYILKVTKAGHDEAEYTVIVSGTPVVKDVTLYKPGTADLDSNGRVNADDAIYLLYHVCFPSAYPLNQSGDFNNDGKVNVDDAYYLLYHVNFPGTYPLS